MAQPLPRHEEEAREAREPPLHVVDDDVSFEEAIEEVVERAVTGLVGPLVTLAVTVVGMAFTLWFAAQLPESEPFASWLVVAAGVGFAVGLLDALGERALPLTLKVPLLMVQMALAMWLFQHIETAWIPWWSDGFTPLRITELTLAGFEGPVLARAAVLFGLVVMTLATLATAAKAVKRWFQPRRLECG